MTTALQGLSTLPCKDTFRWNVVFLFQEAYHLAKLDEQRLLKNRKLVLVVDLDQTIIHTTMDKVAPDLPVSTNRGFISQVVFKEHATLHMLSVVSCDVICGQCASQQESIEDDRHAI